MCQPEQRRKGPDALTRRLVLAEQGWACLYCERTFGSFVTMRGRLRQVMVRWDHMVPWSHQWNNQGSNFAACCQFCNGWKSNMVFSTVEEVKVYVAQKWKASRASHEDL